MPPFVAPPRDGATRRRTVAWVLAGVAVLVICAGGLVGLGGLAVFGTQMIIDQSRAAVTDHLTAVQNGDYQAAYEALCDAERERVSLAEFRRLQEEPGEIISFTVHEPQITEQIVVPADVRYADGAERRVRFLLEQDTETGAFEVCGQQG